MSGRSPGASPSERASFAPPGCGRGRSTIRKRAGRKPDSAVAAASPGHRSPRTLDPARSRRPPARPRPPRSPAPRHDVSDPRGVDRVTEAAGVDVDRADLAADSVPEVDRVNLEDRTFPCRSDSARVPSVPGFAAGYPDRGRSSSAKHQPDGGDARGAGRRLQVRRDGGGV